MRAWEVSTGLEDWDEEWKLDKEKICSLEITLGVVYIFSLTQLKHL